MSSAQPNIVGIGEVQLGRRTAVAPDVQFVFSKPAKVSIGDYCTIGPGVKFVCDGGNVRIGDWTTIHDRSLVLSSVGVEIGEHGWFGQNCVLDGTAGLMIGFGVRFGMNTQVWTHVATGERLEGCTLYRMSSVTIEDEVWLVGSSTVSPGVVIGRRTILLNNSNLTKSWPAGGVLAGSPARLKPGLSYYKAVTLDDKWELLRGWLMELAATQGLVMSAEDEGVLVLTRAGVAAGESVRFQRAAITPSQISSLGQGTTICSVADKRYTKQLTELEHRVLKALAGNKARFLAYGEPAGSQGAELP